LKAAEFFYVIATVCLEARWNSRLNIHTYRYLSF
jgi:hypothetical protein